VLVYGEGRFQASVLVERNPEIASNLSDFEIVEALWPFVETANKKSSAQARITRSLIFVAPMEKRFSRASKGTVQRKATFKNFEAELNKLYTGSKASSQPALTAKRSLPTTVEVNEQTKPVPEPQKLLSKPTSTFTQVNGEDISKSNAPVSAETIRELVNAVCGRQSFPDEKDLFELGMDSLKATEMVERLRELTSSWPIDQEAAIKLLYANPSVHGITKVIKLRTIPDWIDSEAQLIQSAESVESHIPVSESSDVESMLKKYTADLAMPLPTPAKTVVLTGATGSLGCRLLDSLVREPSIARIICLQRGDNGRQKQRDASEKQGLLFNMDKKPVDYFQVDLSRSDLDLKPSQLSDLLNNADAIIHNAWNVDFNQSLTSFETHIAGVRHLADLAARSQRRARLIFVSSISSVINWDTSRGDVPEEIYTDERIVGSNGYSKSKHTAERILEKVAASSNLAISIVRVGQIAGPADSPGAWNASDWLPMLVSTSKALGVLPSSLGVSDDIDWVPIDVVAEVFMDLLRHELEIKAGSKCQVYHITNPRKTSWAALLPATTHVLGENVGLVPFHEWVDRLQRQGKLHYDLTRYPALKILPFYKGMIASPEARMAVLDTTHTLAVSKTLASVEAVQGIWMERWIQPWII
jgi:thioester reductase-like protein